MNAADFGGIQQEKAHMNERIKRILSRAVPLLVLAGISTGAVLYQLEYFDLPFLERPHETDTTTHEPEVTQTPGQAAMESQLTGLETGIASRRSSRPAPARQPLPAADNVAARDISLP